ncbi:MAG TPA: hypothetical protein VF184_11220 [Phycisphaeraceae bacterium]
MVIGIGGPPAQAAHDYQVTVDRAAMTTLDSQWQEYFGMHRSMAASDPWQTIRAPNDFGWRFRPRLERQGVDRPRVLDDPDTGGTIKLDLVDMYNASGYKMDFILTALQDRQKTGVFNMFDRMPAYPLDRDEAYWTYRLMYEFRDPGYNRDHVYIQLGNEINGTGQWNPWPGAVGFNDPDKIQPYVEGFFVEAVKGLYQASRDVYNGNKEAIKVVGPSVANAYEQATFDWVRDLMDYTITGSYTDPATHAVIDTAWSGMENQTVREHVDIFSIQYPFGGGNIDNGQTMLDQYYDEFMANPTKANVEGIWITEELGHGGPRELIKQAARYIDWVAGKGLNADQSRLIWWGADSADDPNDPDDNDEPAEIAVRTLAEYAGEGQLSMETQDQHFEADMWIFLNESDPDEVRLMVIFEPEGQFTLGGIRFFLPSDLADLDWVAEAMQTFSNSPPQVFTPGVLVQGDQVRLDFQRLVDEPVLISLTASLNPEPGSLMLLSAASVMLLARRGGRMIREGSC